MPAQYSDYIQLLLNLQKDIVSLVEILQRKIDATQAFDLDTINECIRKEQALSLSLRGLEQRRVSLLSELGYKDATMRQMPQLCPPQHKAETARVVEVVMKDYEVLASLQQRAKLMLERHLHEVEGALEQKGVLTGAEEGYKSSPPPKPKKMRTDLKV